MFSKELEEVIDAAIADGTITDKERSVLHKRALAEGIDPDELDIVIDGRLAKTKKQEDWLRPTPPKEIETNKVGNIMKCPNCGAPYQPGTGKCPECGFVFQNVKPIPSSQKMADGIQKILDEYACFFGGTEKYRKAERFIADFPIPNTKDDMLEFITSLDAKRKMQDSSGLQSAYKAKYNEVIKKARIIFPDDEQVKNAIEMTDKFSLATITGMQWAAIIVLGAILLPFLLMLIFW
ncbi:MAG: zinc ribbon domain-containing protein [Bacteroidaceae bacterium]|nr:zinc ribbon domain-containing protein [Bacteroidaceae bacterium]